jgi:N-acetylmuramoyl-L-alanine amidase
MNWATGVVLHFTATKDYATAQKVLDGRRLCPTLMVDKDGMVHQVLDSILDIPAAAGGTNDSCVQIEIVAMDEAELLSNRPQRDALISVVRELCQLFDIPRTNADIGSRKGVFSHGQAKKRFGRSAWLWGTDFDPGETYMRVVLEGIGGAYVPEVHWRGRFSDDWVISYFDWLP